MKRQRSPDHFGIRSRAVVGFPILVGIPLDQIRMPQHIEISSLGQANHLPEVRFIGQMKRLFRRKIPARRIGEHRLPWNMMNDVVEAA